MKILLPLAIILSTLTGCANVGAGLRASERGLALVDVGLERAFHDYQEAALDIQARCARQDSPSACELEWGVSDGDIAAVAEAAKLLTDGYQDTVAGVAAMRRAWAIMAPRLLRTVEDAENLSRR